MNADEKNEKNENREVIAIENNNINSDTKDAVDNDGNNKSNNKKSGKKINLPNKLTIFRIVLVPVFMIFILVPVLGDVWSRILAASLILIAAITDFIDGILARKLNLITDFGKLMDPLADKFMIVGAMIAITTSAAFAGAKSGVLLVQLFPFFSAFATTVVFFREFAVTAMRVVANTSEGNVIAANITGKIKTFSQCVCVLTVLLEDIVITPNLNTPPDLFSYITMAVMVIITIFSGYIYFKTYWKYIDPTK